MYGKGCGSVTLSDVAAMAGVSVSTVSKAFSGSRDVSDAVREEIFSLAKRLGCFEKYYKGPREKYIIAIICPENESEYYGNIAGGLEHAFSDRGVDVVIATSRFNQEKEQRIFSELVYRLKVDGVVLIDGGASVKNPDGVPLFAVNSYEMEVQNADSATINFQKGVDEAVAYLKSMGHTRIGFIGEPITDGKYQWFASAMKNCGLKLYPELYYVSSDRFMAAGRQGVKYFLEEVQAPTAVVCAYDYIALGAMEYANSVGVCVPDELSLIGFDNTALSSIASPPLTTIRANTAEAFPQVVDLILKRIDNKFYRMRNSIEIDTSLVIRQSVADISKK